MKEPKRGERVPGIPLLSAYKGKEIDHRFATLLVHKGHAFLATMSGLSDLGTDHSAFNHRVKFSPELQFDTAPVDFSKDQAIEGRIHSFQYKGEYWIVFNVQPTDSKKCDLQSLTRPPILLSYIHAR